MKVSDFDFYLPAELLAEYPAERRDHSRLMVVNRKSGEIHHRYFYEIDAYFRPGDLLVRNNTRVKPVRYKVRKSGPKGALLELLLLKNTGKGIWQVFIDPLKKVREKTRLIFGEGELTAEIVRIEQRRYAYIRFLNPDDEREQEKLLKKLGQMPIPRYIKRFPEALDAERYQTVFASVENALAAPTSALHFTGSLFESLKNKGVNITDLTLAIGQGTFNPVWTERIEDHRMHSESFSISPETAELINLQKAKGKRVVALGTTVVRATESAFVNGEVQSGEFETDIYIYPPYRFRVADVLITNFHTPRSTLLMLVSAFAGYDLMMKAYSEAIRRKYRFFSYGDAMMII